jgi:hypothetical protein
VTSPTHRSEPHPAIWPDKPMPDAERRLLTTLSAGVWLIALAMNVSHVYDHLGQAGIRIDDTRRAVLCLAPDVLLLIGVWKLRYRARSAVAWAMVGTGLAWLSWSALSTAQASPSAWMLAIAPIAVAVLTTLALEFKHAAEPVVEVPALTVDAPTEPAPLLPPPPVAATDVASIPEPLAPRKATAKEPVKAKACPTRQAARQTLLDLDLAGTLAGTTNAELMRTHGGSDVWWGKRRAEYLAELANLGAEAGNL